MGTGVGAGVDAGVGAGVEGGVHWIAGALEHVSEEGLCLTSLAFLEGCRDTPCCCGSCWG